MSKRPRYGSFGSQLLSPPGSQSMSGRGARGRRGMVIFGKSRSARRGQKKRVAVLWFDRTVAKGLSWPQANTFPVPYYTELHYNLVLSMDVNPNAGVFLDEDLFRLNSPYDPVVAVGGAQPYYYDTLFGANGTSAPYGEYRVLRTRVDIQFYNDNTSGAASMMVGCYVGTDLSTTATTAAGAQLLMQRPNGRTVPCPPLSQSGATPGFTMFVDHKQLLGVKDMKDADDQIGPWNGNPPGTPVHLSVFCFPIDYSSTSTGIQIFYRLHITYYVECREQNTVSES